DPTIREWDTSTWKQVGDPWSGHTDSIYALAVNSTGTLITSVSSDANARLWQLSDQRATAIFKASNEMYRATFSVDDRYILCGGKDNNITEWAVPEYVVLEDSPREQASDVISNPFLMPFVISSRARILYQCMLQRDR
ncbi:hypothetical protein AZE42_13017, partial [Rhizopogon vesiculosus]